MLCNSLGNWLRSTARERIQREVLEAARERTRAARQPDRTNEETTPCAVGFVFALGIEAGGLVDLLEECSTRRVPAGVIRQGRLGGRSVVLIESGSGAARTARATEAIWAGHRPGWIVSAGFAGGLIPQVKRHDLILANSVVDSAGREVIVDWEADSASLGPHVHVGRILSVDEIVRKPADKELLGRRHAALAVDLESLAVAEACRREGVRFRAVRVISDAMDEQLPADVQRLADQPTTAARLGAAVGAIWRRPSSVKDFYTLRENALVASDRLARFLADAIAAGTGVLTL